MNPRKKQIIHAAHRLFVEKGFTSTSIQDILDEARISKGTFYNHFTSKNECLMAIIESVSEEADQQRREIALGKRRDDLEVFAAQIAVRMKVNREHNLVALFESVLYSKDEELKAFVKKQHMFEVQWTAERITEIFGPSSRRYALDQAVMLLGMIHHLMNIWLLGSKQEINSDRAIWFALDRLKPMMEDQIQSNEAFFPEDWLVLSTNWPEMNMAEMKERL
ncbi:MAG TPA: TetR/AcrR family transcriptional regulator, partial [Bacillaceae bacterium]